MRGSAARVLLPALVVLALVAIVAVAATGTTATGTGDARAPADTLLDIVITLGIVGVAIGGLMFLYALTQRQLMAREMAKHGRFKLQFIGLAAVLGFLVWGAYLRFRNWEPITPVDEFGEQAFPNASPREPTPGPEITSYEPSLSWITLAAVAALVLIAVGALVVAELRRRGPAQQDDELGEQIAAVLDDTLDDLRAEADPRRAVIAAYARLERVLAAYGLARDPAQTSEEYLVRILGGLAVDEGAVRRLTRLFAEAKFSEHAVDAAMKENAIDALVRVRDELRAGSGASEPVAAPAGAPA
jgi:hypothetical protein